VNVLRQRMSSGMSWKALNLPCLPFPLLFPFAAVVVFVLGAGASLRFFGSGSSRLLSPVYVDGAGTERKTGGKGRERGERG
jgi:hypothetical protein